MVISLVSKSDEGEILFDKRIEFKGGRQNPIYEAGSYYTEKPEEIEALMDHPWYGKEFHLDPKFPQNFEVKAPEPVAPEPDAPEPEAPEPEAEVTAEDEADAPELVAETSLKSIEDITTNPEAFAFLNEIDSELKKTSLRNKDLLKQKAAEMGYVFPNL